MNAVPIDEVYAASRNLTIPQIWRTVLPRRTLGSLVVIAAAACAPVLFLPATEAVIAVLFVLIAVPLCVIDLRLHRLPLQLVLPSAATILFAGGILAAVQPAWSRWGVMVVSSVCFAASLFVLAVLGCGGIGLGDVILGLLVGAVLGWFGPGTIALWSVALLPATLVSYAIERRLHPRPASSRSLNAPIAYGPCMLGAVWLVIITLTLSSL